jgi:uncharacterized protein YuzE
MKFSYNNHDDILMVELNNKKIDYAEQSGSIIVHFSPQREAVLLEILNASAFLKKAATQLPKNTLKSITSYFSSPSLAQTKSKNKI